jgi:hypothetical protein
MVAGVTPAIPTTSVKSNSVIHTTMNTFGTAAGQWTSGLINPGVDFVVTSSNNTETSTVNWAIKPQNWVSGTSNNLVPAAGGSTVTVYTPYVQANSKILLNYANSDIAILNSGILSIADADIVPGTSFTIKSSNALDTNQVIWTIVQNVLGGPAATMGTATLVGGTVTVPTTAVVAATNGVILLTYNTPGGTLGAYIRPSAINDNVSFTITSENALDISTINWAIFPNALLLPSFVAPLGTFTPADDSPATNTTGDVRGTYKPSTPANGGNVLHFTTFSSGFDNFVNQQANAKLPAGGIPLALRTRGPITVDDQMGVQQYYTGTQA